MRWLRSLFVHCSEFHEEGEIPSSLASEYRIRVLRDDSGRAFILKELGESGVGALLRREYGVLRALRGKFAFSIPEPEGDYFNLMLYPRLPGVAAIEVDECGQPLWNVDGRCSRFVDSLANALVQIHRVRLDDRSMFLFGGERDLKTRFFQMLDELEAEKKCMFADLGRWRRWAEATAWPSAPCLIHGDMHAGNIIADDSGSVTGVIDWTHAEYGDPCQDFIFHYLGFGEEGLEQLLRSYDRQGGFVFSGMKEHVMGLWDAYLIREVRAENGA